MLKKQSVSPEQQVCQKYTVTVHIHSEEEYQIRWESGDHVMLPRVIVSCQAIMGGDDRSPSRGKWRPQTREQRTQLLPTVRAAKSSQGN